MALKRKQPSDQVASIMGSALAVSYSPPGGGVFGLSPLEVPPRHGRKKRKDAPSWDKHTSTPYYDGHLWRKYGNKKIKDETFPRLYYKCSYNEDRHCLASKLVQQLTYDDPPLFKVTYIHQHTCNAAPVPAPDIVALAEAQVPAATDGLVLRFSSYGSGHRDGRMQQERQRQFHQPIMSSCSPFQMCSFDSCSWNSQQLQQQPVLHFDVPPPASASSSSFSVIESQPAQLVITNDEVLSTRNSSEYGVEDHHLYFVDHVDFPGSTFSWVANMDVTDMDMGTFTCPTGIEGEETIF